MSDEEIVELFFRRDESAIGETDKKMEPTAGRSRIIF